MSLTSFNMRRSIAAALLSAGAACALAAPVFAGSIKDVPADSKLLPAVISVTSKKLMDAPGGQFNGDKPVTRFELAVTLDRLVNYIENGKKPLHPTKRPHAAKLPSTAHGEVREALAFLTTYNFIGDDSILLKGTGSEPVTANQLKDLLSAVTIRLSDRAVSPPQF
jgi:hypothetical protein